MEFDPDYRPVNRHMNHYIQPGRVGSVGDVLGSVRLKQSEPNMAMRWDKTFNPSNSSACGSNVQDGQQVSWESGGGGARVIHGRYGNGRGFKTRRGYVIEDITAADMMVEPYVSSLGDYTWRDKVAKTYESLRTGAKFHPLPEAYALAPGQVGRGGNVPRVRAVAGGDEMDFEMTVDATQMVGANAVEGEVFGVGIRQVGGRNHNLAPRAGLGRR